jgi:hypothetical protein
MNQQLDIYFCILRLLLFRSSSATGLAGPSFGGSTTRRGKPFLVELTGGLVLGKRNREGTCSLLHFAFRPSNPRDCCRNQNPSIHHHVQHQSNLPGAGGGVAVQCIPTSPKKYRRAATAKRLYRRVDSDESGLHLVANCGLEKGRFV